MRPYLTMKITQMALALDLMGSDPVTSDNTHSLHRKVSEKGFSRKRGRTLTSYIHTSNVGKKACN